MSKPVIVLDPGHGGYDPGAVYHGLEEKDLNLKLALQVATSLGRSGAVKVLLTRERDIYVSLADRVALSRRAGADLFLSLHANAGGGRGFESFVHGTGDALVEMQEAVHDEVVSALARWSIIDRGLKQAAFYVLRHNPAPAILIESLFIDNRREAALWQDKRFVETLAGAVVRGVRTALELPAEENRDAAVGEASGPAEGSTLYTVQVGAFSYIENARQRLAEAQGAGFSDAYIYQKQF